MMFMDNKIKLGATCSILAGIFYLLISVAFLLLPSEQQIGPKEIEGFYQSAAQSMLWFQFMMSSFVFTSVLGLAVVLSLYDFLDTTKNEWIRFCSLLAIIAFSNIAIFDLHHLKNIPHLANSYVEANQHVQATLEIIGIGYDDSIVFAFIGLWMITINYFAAKVKKIPRIIGILGYGAGASYFFITTAYLAEIDLLYIIAAIIGVFLVPAWYISIGIILQKN